MMPKTVLITGASAGIGKATAYYFAQQGWNVVATMRSPEAAAGNIFVTRLDVEEPASIESAIQQTLEKFGSIDVLVNNAGYGQSGLFEAVSPEKVQKQFDVNVFGMMNTIRAILPPFRQQKSGTIINVSSGAGRLGFPIMSIYCASKFALEGFSEALSYELASIGVAVKIVEPGGVYTNFGQVAGEVFAFDPQLTEYDSFHQQANQLFDAMRSAKLTQAEDVAQLIYTASTDGRNTLRYQIGEDIRPFVQARISSNSDDDYMRFMQKSFFGA